MLTFTQKFLQGSFVEESMRALSNPSEAFGRLTHFPPVDQAIDRRPFRGD